MNLSDEDVRNMLGKQPTLLHLSADRNLAPTILFLVRALDLSKSELRTMVMECPSILSYSLENLRKKIAFFAALNNGEDGIDSIRELLVGTPKLLLASVDTGLVPKLKFMTNEINFSLDEIRRLVKRNPKLLLYSLDENLREKIVFFFILQLHMEPQEVRRILLAYPQIMNYNLENHLKPISEYFMTELKFSAAEVGSITLKFPRLFSYSLFKIKHVIGFLRYELELDPRQVKRVFFQAPQVLGLGESSLKEKLNFLRNRLNLTTEELGLVLSKMPTLVCLGIESSLVPKLEYLEKTLLDERPQGNQLLREIILKQPTILGYSLHGRLQPRMEQLLKARIPPSKITVGITMSEIRFHKWLSSSQSKRMVHALSTHQNFAASKALHRVLNFNEEELNWITAELPSANWTVPSLESWTKYLNAELNISINDLKSAVLSYPQLLDSSSRPRLRRRLKMLRSVGTVLDYLDATRWSEDKFDDWIRRKKIESKSKINYLRRLFGLNESECRAILLKMPSLESAPANKLFQQKLDYVTTHVIKSTEGVKQLLLEYPLLLDLSIKRTLEPRMQNIRQIGISDPSAIISLLSLSDDAFSSNTTLTSLKKQFSDTIEYVQSTLQLRQNETDSLVLSLANNFTVSNRIKDTLGCLVTFANGEIVQIKDAVLQQPKLLLTSSDDIIKKSESKWHGREEMLLLLSMTDEDYQTFLSLKILRKCLNFTEEEIESLFAESSRTVRPGKNPKLTLAGRIDYLLSLASKDNLKKAIIFQPKLLSHPLEKLHITSALKERAELQTRLDMTDSEMDILVPMEAWLVNRRLQMGVVTVIQYLTFHLNGSIDDLKRIFLEEPKLLTLSFSKTIKPRMDLLLRSGCHPTIIGKIGMLSLKEAEDYILKCYFCERLGFSTEQIIHVFGSLGRSQLSLGLLRKKIDYLLRHVFGGSKLKLREFIIQDPSILKQSAEQIQLRADILLYLKSIGLECSANDINGFISQPESRIARELCHMETWNPGVERKVTIGDFAYEKNDMLESLKYFPPPPTLAYFDQDNRESSRVVHWRDRSGM